MLYNILFECNLPFTQYSLQFWSASQNTGLPATFMVSLGGITVYSTLPQLKKALRGLVVMSGELEDMANSLFNQFVPKMWESKAVSFCLFF